MAFVLVSWHPNVPAGMERATHAHAAALIGLGARAVIITADRRAPHVWDGIPIEHLSSLNVDFPCDDTTLRDAALQAQEAITEQLQAIIGAHQVSAVVYIDALWGLGLIMPTSPTSTGTSTPHHDQQEDPEDREDQAAQADRRVRHVLAAHVVGHDIDLRASLAREPHTVIAPSAVVLHQARARGYDTSHWQVVPNPLTQPTAPEPQAPAPDRQDDLREHLRTAGPVRVLARLGAEKGVADLLQPLSETPGELGWLLHRDRQETHPSSIGVPVVDVALAAAPFEVTAGAQDEVRARCERLAHQAGPSVAIRPGMPWHQTGAWLAGASVVVVPSLAETFGMVALEAMSGGTPVVAYDVGNLPSLIGDAGVSVPRDQGPIGLWRAAQELLQEPVRYRAASRAGYYRSRDYGPALVARQLLKVVS
ncbi:glycosyltransferase family 4 protein [Kineosporia rhizophila]|uniref:glycosyltransferase family 4 protein n=1 Tax=Kineosporia rhizophila TaxID=84633 RepID=UPI001E58659A|nr:glycosyltransferase family 4 protein [Kineosporia rhizophila]